MTKLKRVLELTFVRRLLMERTTKSNQIKNFDQHVLYSLVHERCVSLGSPETNERRSPRLSNKRWPSVLIGPGVSIAVGTKMCDRMMSAYFALFRSAAASADPHRVVNVVGVWEFVWVSTTVTFHVGRRTLCQRTRINPSGRFPSPPSRPVDSFAAGTLARLRALHVARSMWWWWWWWWVERLVLLLLDSPWVPHEVIVVPQGQKCASPRISSRRRATATRMASLVRRIDRMRWLAAHEASLCCVRLWKPTTLPCPSRMLHHPK